MMLQAATMLEKCSFIIAIIVLKKLCHPPSPNQQEMFFVVLSSRCHANCICEMLCLALAFRVKRLTKQKALNGTKTKNVLALFRSYFNNNDGWLTLLYSSLVSKENCLFDFLKQDFGWWAAPPPVAPSCTTLSSTQVLGPGRPDLIFRNHSWVTAQWWWTATKFWSRVASPE